MLSKTLKSRSAKCREWWYPSGKTEHNFVNNPIASAVISPHAGFEFSGMLSMKAISYVKKNRVWILGTSHYERINSGISIFDGEYYSSIGKAVFPGVTDDTLLKYYSSAGHRTDEHSIENVLYCINHFSQIIKAFCVLVQINDENDFNAIAGDISSVWKEGDSIVISTDWNHFVSVHKIDRLMQSASNYLTSGNIEKLYHECQRGNLEACGIDALFLASKILAKVGESVNFNILESTDSSLVTGRKTGDKCVGYIAAANVNKMN
jgi:AmmeMemoRadiSam system protein B